MVKQTETNVVRKLSELNEIEASAVLDYISEILSKRQTIKAETLSADDLIQSLSNRRENVRACQVVEWERTRRKSFSKAA